MHLYLKLFYQYQDENVAFSIYNSPWLSALDSFDSSNLSNTLYPPF